MFAPQTLVCPPLKYFCPIMVGFLVAALNIGEKNLKISVSVSKDDIGRFLILHFLENDAYVTAETTKNNSLYNYVKAEDFDE